jgi:hypothetical protein
MEKIQGGVMPLKYLRYIKRGLSPRFELLCACCHAIEGKVNKRNQGANQHKQPALVRASKQKPGQPERRVRNKAEIEAEKAERRFLAAMRRQTSEDRSLL